MFYKFMNMPTIQNLNFKGATININALSDTHGKLERTDLAYQNMLENKDDLFLKEKRGNKNFLVIGGDWYISGDRKGYKTDPNKPLSFFQTKMLNKFIEKVKEIVPKNETIFVPGNHELDGGVDLFFDAMDEVDANIVATNIDLKKSPKLLPLIKREKLVNSKISFVQDDKNENVYYPILNLGIMPVNLSYYQKNTEGISLEENTHDMQKNLTPEKYKKTKNIVVKKVKEFKEKYPNGIVILTTHTGAQFGDECAKECQIDIVFDGHEHKTGARITNGTPIVSLNRDFEKMVNAKIYIDDEGNKKGTSITSLNPIKSNIKNGEINDFYKNLFSKDTKNIYMIMKPDKYTDEFDVSGIRTKSTNLANFVVDVIYSQIRNIDPDVDIFALNSTAIRGGFKTSNKPAISNFEVLSALNGIRYNEAEILTNEVSGKTLAMMVTDNFLFNENNGERNAIIHYSGIKTDREGLLNGYKKGLDYDELCKYITFEKTNKKIDPNETYKIANVEKYFDKASNPDIKSLKDSAIPLNAKIQDLFLEFFKENPIIKYVPTKRF